MVANTGSTLFFRQVGQGSRALVVLHGIFGSGDNWLTVAKSFDPSYTVYLVDQRNHGRSFHHPSFNYEVMVADLALWLDEQSIEQPVIVGHSMGGKVLMNFACQLPDRLRAAVVVDIAPRAYNIHHRVIVDGLKALDLPSAQSRQEVESRLEPFVQEWDTRQFLMKNLYRNDDGVFALRINLEAIDENLHIIGEPLADGLIYKGPSLFIRGSKSHYVRDEDLQDLRSHFPSARVQTIQNAGHWVQAEQPQAFAQALNTFLGSLDVI